MPKRSDGNQAKLVAVYRKLGASVIDLHELGHDIPDLLVAIPGVMDLSEVKTEDGKLSPGQIDFQKRWPVPVSVVRTVEDVEAHVARMRSRQ
jgi:hypothetical protein